MPHLMYNPAIPSGCFGCDKGFHPVRGHFIHHGGKNCLIAARNMTRVRSWIYKCLPLYSDLAWLHKTLLTHTYLSKHVCRGHQTSSVDSRPALLPAYTKYVLECQRRWIPALLEYLPALDLAVPTIIKGIPNMEKWAYVTSSVDWTDMKTIFFET